MGDDSRLEGKIKAQITRFASRLTDGWAKPLRFNLHQPPIADKFWEDVLGDFLGRFFGGHQPGRGHPGRRRMGRKC